MQEFQTIYSSIGIVGVLAFIVWKLLEKFVFKNDNTSLKKHLIKLETNHMAHFSQDIANIKEDISEIKSMQKDQGKDIVRIRERVSRLEP